MTVDSGWITAGFTAAASIVAAGFSWLAARSKGKADIVSGQAAMIKAAQEAANAMIGALQTDISSLRADAVEDRGRIDELERQLVEERKKHRDERHVLANRASEAEGRAHQAELRAAEAERRAYEMEGRCAQAEGVQRNLQQQLDSLMRGVRAVGVDVPAPPSRSTEPIILGEAQA